MRLALKLKLLAAVAAAGVLLGVPSQAADDPALSRDLTSTIALLGQPCGKVVRSERQGSNDYIATCQDKNRYRVTLNARGKVVAKKL
jgi:hypothetical protein